MTLTQGQRKNKTVNSAETKKMLQSVLKGRMSLNDLEAKRLDPFETAKAIAKAARILRVAANNAGLGALRVSLEDLYYECYSYAPSTEIQAERESTEDQKFP